MSDMQVKRGRPTRYSAVIGQEICDAIASSSKGTKRLCEDNSHWPCQDTLFTWLKKKGIDDALIQPYSGHENRASLEVAPCSTFSS
jgi:hypothetical protein